MTDKLIPLATIESEDKGTLTLAYDTIEHCVYALDLEGNEVEKVASPELADQGQANDFVQASYGSGWGLSWID